MEANVPATSHPASPADPSPDRPGGTVPERSAFLLHAVGILLGDGRHLLDTVRHRATAPTFTTIAACFGTAKFSTHLIRGILRVTALERALLARTATGRDINIPPSRVAATCRATGGRGLHPAMAAGQRAAGIFTLSWCPRAGSVAAVQNTPSWRPHRHRSPTGSPTPRNRPPVMTPSAGHNPAAAPCF